MTILETNKIDLIAKKADQRKLLLMAFDHDEWSCAVRHQRAIQDKLNAYLAYVESTELESAISFVPESIEIRLMMQFHPADAVQEFLEQAGAFLEQNGYVFTVHYGHEER